MTFLCTNGDDCELGETWEDDDGRIHVRPHEAYSQHPEYRQDGRVPYMGMCLNCYQTYLHDLEMTD